MFSGYHAVYLVIFDDMLNSDVARITDGSEKEKTSKLIKQQTERATTLMSPCTRLNNILLSAGNHYN